MIKAKKICNKCRRVKGLSCDCPPPKKYTSFKQNNYKLYNSRKWRKYAHALRKDNPLCKHCLEEGRTTPSSMVDHIKPINQGGEVWDVSNHQCLCKSCHARKSSKDKDLYKK